MEKKPDNMENNNGENDKNQPQLKSMPETGTSDASELSTTSASGKLNNDGKDESKPPEDNTDGTSTANESELVEAGKITDMISGKKFYVLLTGKTLKAHKKVIDHLKGQRSDLQEVDKVEECDFILVFCPVVSRAGTDIEAAVKKLQNEAGNKPAVLVVLHHTFDPGFVVPDSSRAVKRKNSITDDCLFHEDQGLLQCHKNDESLESITNSIKESRPNSWWGYLSGCFPANEDNSQYEEKMKVQPDLKTNENDGSVLRLVLLGRTRSDKAAVKNTILGREAWDQAATSAATSTATQQSESTEGEVAGRKVTVVDTPDWFTPGLPLEKMRQDVERCVQLCKPGPHAFLLVIPVKPPAEDKEVHTEEELKVIFLKIEEIFGMRCFKNIIILFTFTDDLQKTEKLIQSGNQEVQRLLEKCGNRIHFLNIKESGDGSQISKLLENMVEECGGDFYSSEIYLKTLAQIGEIERMISEKLMKLDDPATELMKKMKELKDEKTKREHEQEQAEETDRSTKMDQNLKRLTENSEMPIWELHKEERNEMKTTMHEIWRSILTSSMKMQEEEKKEGNKWPIEFL